MPTGAFGLLKGKWRILKRGIHMERDRADASILVCMDCESVLLLLIDCLFRRPPFRFITSWLFNEVTEKQILRTLQKGSSLLRMPRRLQSRNTSTAVDYNGAPTLLSACTTSIRIIWHNGRQTMRTCKLRNHTPPRPRVLTHMPLRQINLFCYLGGIRLHSLFRVFLHSFLFYRVFFVVIGDY